jgi:hypothetical protein
MKQFFLLLCCTGLLVDFSIMSAWADNTSELREQILSSMAKQPNKRFYFRQEKKLAMLQKPLISEGELLVDGSNGVIWDIRKPYVMRYVITDKQIREIDDQGERTIRTADNPVAAALTEAMKTAFSGDWNEKTSGVDITATGTRDSWQLQMLPRTNELKKMVVSIIVDGSSADSASDNSAVHVNAVRITESNGDTATIYLQPIAGGTR